VSVEYRHADASDAAAVAALHADSWRRHYRGVYADEYLDGAVEEERLSVWSERFAHPSPDTSTVLAEIDGALVGFAHVIFDVDPVFGALLDNLHVGRDVQRRGIGAELMKRAAHEVAAARPNSQLYLWVLEPNAQAQAFYRSIGGHEADRKPETPPGGGSVTIIRYVWPDPRSLL
jgi:GNAT superfamily N-acetyltransferase